MSSQTERELETRLALFSLLCSNLVWILPGSGLAAFALALALQGQLPSMFLVSWICTVTAILVVRGFYLHRWLKDPTTSTTVQSRLRTATGLTCATACCFGLVGYLAVSPDNPLISLLVVMVLTGMVASATAAISYLLPMYLSFIIPIMFPAGLRMMSFGQPSTAWIGGLMMLYLIVCLGSSRSIRASILRSIQLRFDNMELLDDLKHQHKRAEVSLAREEKANLAKSRFLAAASHDLRQPLHSLRLFTATLEMQTRNTQHKTLVGQIDSSVKSLEELFNALLDISKLDAGTINVDLQHIYMDSLLSQIEAEFKAMTTEKMLDFHVELNNHVIHTDALLLETLMRNLVGNAIRYTESGSVSISSSAAEGRVWISVIDTGIGIPLADQKRIFEEFVQLGNAERDRNQGIGLGLSIVKRLADLLDVIVEVESVAGEGAHFRIGVPEGDEAQYRFTHSPDLTMPDHLASLFVLVIDDEEEACLAVEGLLETWGCVVMCAQSGDAAIQQLREIGDTPDLILSDYRLRDGETGGDVIMRIRRQFGLALPAIILTGDIAPERLRDIKALGFPLLHKPCEPDVLRELIARETSSAKQSLIKYDAPALEAVQ